MLQPSKPITIVPLKDLTDYTALKKNSKVLCVLDLPYDYVLFRFWDDAYKDIYNKDKKYYADPKLKEKASELRKEENALIGPLYARSTPANFVTALGFGLNGYMYEMPFLRKDRFIETMYWKVDSIDQNCIFEADFKELTDKKKAAFEKVIADWQQWALGSSLLNSCEPPVYEDKKAVLKIHFPEKFEDTLAALIIMLNHTRLKTGIVKLVY